MLIKKLRLVNFRNHIDKLLNFDRINYISGANGTGKTSIAEAISVILTLKSFKQHNFKKLINFNKNFFYLNAKLLENDKHIDVKFKYSEKKELLINNNKENIETYLKDNIFFSYSPENEGILSNNQKYRRSFIDKTIFYKNFEFINFLRDYNKILKIKKKHLESEKIDIDYLKVINEKLENLSNYISEYRRKEIEIINKKLNSDLKNIIRNENFELILKKSIPNDKHFTKEIILKKIITGCHLDKIYFSLNGKINDGFASFGQRKTFSLLTLASILLSIEDLIKNDIILVLDDFEVGLDSNRIDVFKSIFSSYQIVITGVENRFFKDANNIVL